MSEMIFGRNTIVESIKQNRKIEKVYTISNNKDIISLSEKYGIAYEIVNKDFINSKVTGNHQGVLAYVKEYEYFKLNDIVSDKEDSLIVMLDCFEDPHNLGAVIRTGETAGVDGIIIPKRRAAGVNSTVTKVAAGAVEHMNIARVNNINEAIRYLKENDVWVCGTDIDTNKYHYNQDLTGSIAIVIGSEGFGMSKLVKENCDFLVKIPMKGKITSLNASVSAGIVVYEAVRQRNINK